MGLLLTGKGGFDYGTAGVRRNWREKIAAIWGAVEFKLKIGGTVAQVSALTLLALYETPAWEVPSR